MKYGAASNVDIQADLLVDVLRRLGAIEKVGHVHYPPTTTGNRPSAVAAGAGAYMYDLTLHVPIWSDGAVWRNAAGGAV